MAEHLRDPLDYLYEELPPERMAEARKHLAACPSCRADMRAVREMVKIYRQAEKPKAPAGLAARTTRIALEEARKATETRNAKDAREASEAKAAGEEKEPPRARTVPPLPPPPPNMAGMRGVNGWEQPVPVDLDSEFARLKEEVLREIPKGWRTWLFHPAWTVAASVIFICAVLIHFSPRMNQPETRYIPSMPMTRDDDVIRQLRERERLPSSQPRQPDAVIPATPVPAPLLQTATVMNETVPDIPIAVEPEPKSESESELISAREPASATPTTPLAPEPAAEKPVAETKEEKEPDAVFAPPVPPPEISRGESAPPPALPSGAMPIELLESLGEKTKALAESEASSVVVWEDLDAAAVPQLIERPPAYDPAERIQSLTALAGMQMASGEFADAWQTVGLLDSYDAAAAKTLGATLRDLEHAARAKAEEEAQEATPPIAAPEPEPEPEPVISVPEPEPIPELMPEPEPVPAPEPEPASDLVFTPEPVFESEPLPEPVLVFESSPAPVYAPMIPVMIIPAPAPQPLHAAPPKSRPFTTDPYFRDY